MKESSTYQAILDEGRQEGETRGVRQIIMRQGRQKFGVPSETITAALTAINDLERLGRMADQILVASSWEELLATP